MNKITTVFFYIQYMMKPCDQESFFLLIKKKELKKLFNKKKKKKRFGSFICGLSQLPLLGIVAIKGPFLLMQCSVGYICIIFC